MGAYTAANDEPPLAATIDEFAEAIAPVSPRASCASVHERFGADDDLVAVPVVEGTRPVGIVGRNEFEHRLAHAYGRALYERKPITTLMDPSPLVVDRATPIETIQRTVATDRPSALLRGFIVTTGGAYLGLCSALGLVQATLRRSEERNRELDRARRDAVEASRAKSTFLANVSHELRTPLNAIIGFSEIMKGGLLGALPARYVDYAADIHASGRHLLAIVNDLLDMAKIEAGRYELSEAMFDLADVIDAIVRMTSPAVARAGLRLDVGVDRALPPINGDERGVRQILLNLVSNAIKFTRAQGRVSITARRAARGVVLAVSDTGVGMTQAEIVVALMPFGQVSADLNRRHEGAGLGLPLAKGIAEVHGAAFAIASVPGGGTTVTVSFPPERCEALALGA
jgi:two-component system cell cycle sensor histidine kinase PleC